MAFLEVPVPLHLTVKGVQLKLKKLYISEANGLKFTLNHATLKTYYAASYLLHVKEECLKLGIQKMVV